MAPKKKKKAATNPARGFATTSIPAKTRMVDSDAESTTKSTSVATPGTSTPERQAEDGVTGREQEHDDPSVQNMTPAELERHLEDAELQDLLDRNGPRCRTECRRQLIRLENDRRQSRTYTHALHPRDWLDDDLVARSLAHFDQAPDTASRTPLEAANDEKLVLELWVLYRVIAALQFPDVDGAMRHVINLSITGGIKPSSSMTYGLQEAFEWFALHYNESDLRQAEALNVQQQENVLDTPIADIACKTSIQNNDSAVDATNGRSMPSSDLSNSEESDLDDDDDGGDDDPSQLVNRWLQLQTRLWRIGNQEAGKNTKRSRLLQERVHTIERDILFEKDEAEHRWLAVKIGLQRETSIANPTGKTLSMQHDQQHGHAGGTGSDRHDASESVSVVDSGGVADDDVFGTIFETIESTATEDAAETVQIHHIGKYTGLSPQSLLKQVCQGVDSKSTLKFSTLHQSSYSARQRLQCSWSKPQIPDDYAVRAVPEGVSTRIAPQNWMIEMTAVATSSVSSSVDFVAAVALSLVFSLAGQDEKTARRLPGVWSNLLSERRREQTRLSEKDEKSIILHLRELISEIRATNFAIESKLPLAFRPGKVLSPSSQSNFQGHAREVLGPEAARQAWSSRASRNGFKKMLEFRTQLPIYRHKERVLQTIAENSVVIICAETGSGKSTQAGSYILEQELTNGNDFQILVTQPRRISAISLARRVSQEIGESRADLGTPRSLVGFAIRMESKTSQTTRLTFATTGVLLRMLETSPTLDHLNYLILDEVHERSMDMDLAFIALRRLQKLRPSLKIILMSATVNATQFSNYFDGAPVLDIEGRTFPVTVRYLEDAIEITNGIGGQNHHSQSDEDTDQHEHEASDKAGRGVLSGYSVATIQYLAELNEHRIDYGIIVRLATAIATKVELREFSKAILIFMPGIAEIRRLNNLLLSTPIFASRWNIHMLHSSFSTDELERAFVVPVAGCRKIVIATNIAETGITIPDVTAVIDTCKEKIMRFDERRQLSRLTEGFTARSSAKQRRGRAARVQPGLCFHLVTKHRHDNLFLEQEVPEMLRLSLQDSIMRIKIWDGDASIEQTLAAAIDPPPKKNVTRAIERLKEAGALDAGERLTALGESVARLPLDVSLAKLAVLGAVFGCLEPILTIISLMTSKSIFSATGNGKAAFIRSGSDQLSALNAYESWQRAGKAGQGPQFARKHHLVNLFEIEESKIQLLVYLVDGGLVRLEAGEKTLLSTSRVSSSNKREAYHLPERYNHSVSDDLLLSLIAASSYPRCLAREGKGYRNVFSNQQVAPARGSVIREMPKPPQWLSFSEAMRTKTSNSITVQEASRIPDMALSLFLGSDVDVNFFSGVLNIDGRIRLKVSDWKRLLAIKLLRKQIRALLERQYRSSNPPSGEDEQLLCTLRTAGLS